MACLTPRLISDRIQDDKLGLIAHPQRLATPGIDVRISLDMASFLCYTNRIKSLRSRSVQPLDAKQDCKAGLPTRPAKDPTILEVLHIGVDRVRLYEESCQHQECESTRLSFVNSPLPRKAAR